MWPKVDVELMFWCSAYFWISDLLNLLEWETPWKTWFRAWTCWTCLRGRSYIIGTIGLVDIATQRSHSTAAAASIGCDEGPHLKHRTSPLPDSIEYLCMSIWCMVSILFWMVYFLTSIIPWFNPGVNSFFSGGFHGPWASMFHQAAPRVNSTRSPTPMPQIRHPPLFSPSNHTLNCTRNSPEQHPLSNNKVTNCGTKLLPYEK